VSDTRVGHTCRVHFQEFVMCPRVMSILTLPCPCNIAGQQMIMKICRFDIIMLSFMCPMD